MIQLTTNFGSLPAGYSYREFSMGSSNSSPIVVAKSPTGELAGCTSVKGSDGKYYPGVLIQRLGSETGQPLADAHSSKLAQEILLAKAVEAGGSLGNVKVWFPIKGYGLVSMNSYFQVDKDGYVFNWAHYFHPPTSPGQQPAWWTDRRDWGFVEGKFVAVRPDAKPPGFVPWKADGKWHSMINMIDSDKITCYLDDKFSVIDVPTESEFRTFQITDYLFGNMWVKGCERTVFSADE